jgi:NADPH:quinone reductase-like Zn-dependent oxidoreductase
MRPVAERRAAFDRLIDLGQRGKVRVDVTNFTLAEAAQAWDAQRLSPHGKIIVSTGH